MNYESGMYISLSLSLPIISPPKWRQLRHVNGTEYPVRKLGARDASDWSPYTFISFINNIVVYKIPSVSRRLCDEDMCVCMYVCGEETVS
jgi:hypothetical protein